MKNLFLILCITGLFTSTAWAEDTLMFLHGTWEGTGTTSGMDAEVQHMWVPALDGRFLTLRLHNRMTLGDGTEFVFEGNGYYQAWDVAQRAGVWIDSNGEILPLQIAVDGHFMNVVWGSSDTKLGRSTYRLLENGTLETTDFIANAEGKWKKFGHAILHKVSIDE